ncbi:chorismate lyase [Rosenbergiella australiborealis]|uniref:chorismate lyase n=1 Tax=Rosenbergiella australiborealis TaxID=1544696 RepID=UPI001F4EEA14|nr:chorismate lyase [Rosenbergiella australiborealis]
MGYQPVETLLTDHFSALSATECLPEIYSWLVDESSMTARLEALCRVLEVSIVKEGFITALGLSADEQSLLRPHANDQRFWLREVQLIADGSPWLAGRTVIPENTLQGPETALTALGNRPLGHYLFQNTSLSRDYLNPGIIGGLWARRSLLRLAKKPLLLTEIFLPDSPLYQSSAKGSSACTLLPVQK